MTFKLNCVGLILVGIFFSGYICASNEKHSKEEHNFFNDFENSDTGRKLFIPIIASLFHKTNAPAAVAPAPATTPSPHIGDCANLPRTSTCGINDIRCDDDRNCTASKKCCRQRGVQCCVDAPDLCGLLSSGNLACSDLIKQNPAKECHDDFDCGYGLKCCSDGQSHHKCCSDIPAVCKSVAGKCPAAKDDILSCERNSDCGSSAKCCSDTDQKSCCTSIEGICSKFGTIQCDPQYNGHDVCVQTRFPATPLYACNMLPSQACCMETGGATSCCLGWSDICRLRGDFKCGGRHRCNGPGQHRGCHDTEICCGDSGGINCCVSKFLL